MRLDLTWKSVVDVQEWSPWAGEDIRWSWHVLALLTECPEKFRLAVHEGLESTDYRPALGIGSAVHAGTAAFAFTWQIECAGLEPKKAAERCREVALEAVNYYCTTADLPDKDRDTALQLVAAYAKRWGRSMRGVRVVAIEEAAVGDLSVIANVPEGTVVRPRLDQVVYLEKDNKVGPEGMWVLDTKTQGKSSGSIERAYSNNGQALINVASWNAANPALAAQGFCVDVIHKGTEPKCERAYVTFTEGQMSAFSASVYHWLGVHRRLVEEVGPGEVWPRSYNCIGRYGACQFLGVCAFDDRSRVGVRGEPVPKEFEIAAGWESDAKEAAAAVGGVKA